MDSSVLKQKWNPEVISKFDLVSLRRRVWNRNLKLKSKSRFQFLSLRESETWNLKSKSRFRFLSLSRVWNLKSEIEPSISISFPARVWNLKSKSEIEMTAAVWSQRSQTQKCNRNLKSKWQSAVNESSLEINWDSYLSSLEKLWERGGNRQHVWMRWVVEPKLKSELEMNSKWNTTHMADRDPTPGTHIVHSRPHARLATDISIGAI